MDMRLFLIEGGLLRFLDRLFLLDVGPAYELAHEHFRAAHPHGKLPDEVANIKVAVYRQVLNEPRSRVPDQLPAQLPHWHGMISPSEQQFLELSLLLNRRQRFILFLNRYAGLTAEELSELFRPIYRTASPQNWASYLQGAWNIIFNKIAGSQ
jgi:hypothetical protein